MQTNYKWILAQSLGVADGSGTAKALYYSVKRWAAPVRYLDDGQLPIDNSLIHRQIRPVALGRANWLFAGPLRAGKRAAAITSLIEFVKLNVQVPDA